MSRVARKVRDQRLLTLIGRYLRAGVMVDGVLHASEEGTPQGGPASPFLANILLDDLDKELERRGLPFVRYADDFVIFTKSRRMSELRTYLRGWIGYFGLAAQWKLFDKFDQWLRRRLRMCYWKRWRHARTRRRELIRLGVPRRQAIRHARSRKGPWHMAKSIATGVGLTNAWLQTQGLLSLKTLWAQLAPLRRTA